MFRASLAHRQELRTVHAAYDSVILLYVMVHVGSTILSIGLWLMSYNIVWMFIGCGLRELVPLVGNEIS